MQYKLALLPPPKYSKTFLCNHLGIQMNSCGLSKCLCSQQGQTLRKLWRGPQYFVNVGSVASENASGLRGFEVQRRYQNSIARMVVVFSSV